ncbi:MAG: HAD family hydrolase [Elusimicrobiaceae bacterium]|nr:HAD family hydrolase [Elusimicrobiaceae bacterium]
MTAQIKAIFFDRDGTLIHEKPGVYLSDPAKVRPYQSVPAALRMLKKAGYHFFIVSNQSGIGRGYFTEKEVNAVHARLQQLLRPAIFEEIVFCPHAPNENCTCRKPQPKMGLQLIKKYHINPTQSCMIGDKKADVEFGKVLGFKTILVTTANGKNHLKKYPELHPDKVASNLLNAARFILKQEK